MDSTLGFYQHIPQYIDPVAFSIGFFAIRWYSLMYIVGFIVVISLLSWRIKRGELSDKFPTLPTGSQVSNSKFLIKTEIRKFKSQKQELIPSLLLVGFWGMLIGGRLGYVIFYDPAYYLQNPLEIFLPISIAEGGLQVTGFYGMSYHGGLLGVVVSAYIFSKMKRLDFWQITDFVAPAAAGAYFFGRVGNFLNGELYGRETNFFWGMYSGADDFLRHPSQLYEAFFEGAVLFFFLWLVRNRAKFDGQIFLIYIIGYAFFRYILEYFRAPDAQIGLIGGILSVGQLLSLAMMLIGILFYCRTKQGK